MIPKSVVSDWMTVSQEQIQMFADATCDQQWIHVDPARAQRESSFGGTIVHGFLTLSLIGVLLRKTEALDGFRMSVNYGLNRVRFTAPVPAGSRIRGLFAAGSVEVKDESLHAVWSVTVAPVQRTTPSCVAVSLPP